MNDHEIAGLALGGRWVASGIGRKPPPRVDRLLAKPARDDDESRSRGGDFSVGSAEDAPYVCWFHADSHPCFIFNLGGTLRDANPAALELFETGVATLRGGRVDFGSAEGGEALNSAFEDFAQRKVQRRRVVLMGQDGVWRSLEMLPLGGGDQLVFMAVRTQARASPLAMQALVEAFRLTPAQAEVVDGLAAGLVPKEISRRMGVTTHTVRTHLRAIYAKLGVRGIAGVLRLTAQLLD